MQALYQLDVQGPDAFDFLNRFFIEQDVDNSTRELASDWTKGA